MEKGEEAVAGSSFSVRQKEIISDVRYIINISRKGSALFLFMFFPFELLFLASILIPFYIFDLDTLWGAIFRVTVVHISNFQIYFPLTEFDSYNILLSPELEANEWSSVGLLSLCLSLINSIPLVPASPTSKFMTH